MTQQELAPDFMQADLSASLELQTAGETPPFTPETEYDQEAIDETFDKLVDGLDITTSQDEKEVAVQRSNEKANGSGDKPGKWWAHE